jgi:hypothetical protein
MEVTMSDQDKPLFQGMDEYEREYAPEELPADDPERKRAHLDKSPGEGGSSDLTPPGAGPVATLGTSPSGEMAAIIRTKDQEAADAEADSSKGEDVTPEDEA